MNKWIFGGLASLLSIAVAGAALLAGTVGVLAAERDVAPTARTGFMQAADRGGGSRMPMLLGQNGEARGGKLGLSLRQLDGDLAAELGLSRTEGVVVTAVAAGSVAESAGFQANDVILSINGTQISDLSQVREVLSQAEVGSNVQFSVARGSQTVNLTVTVPEGGVNGGHNCGDRGDGSGTTSSSSTRATRFARLGR